MPYQPPNNDPWQQQPFPQQPNTSYSPQQPMYPPQPFPSQPLNQQQYPPPYQQQPPVPPTGSPKKKSNSCMWIVVVVIALVVCSCIGSAFASHSSRSTSGVTATTAPAIAQSTDTPVPTDTPQPTDTPTPAPSVAYQLAYIDSGGSISSGDVSVAQYQTLLDTMHRKTGDSEQTIGDETVAGRDLVKSKYGKDVTLLELLLRTDQSLPEGTKIHYNEVLAAYITLAYS